MHGFWCLKVGVKSTNVFQLESLPLFHCYPLQQYHDFFKEFWNNFLPTHLQFGGSNFSERWDFPSPWDLAGPSGRGKHGGLHPGDQVGARAGDRPQQRDPPLSQVQRRPGPAQSGGKQSQEVRLRTWLPSVWLYNHCRSDLQDTPLGYISSPDFYRGYYMWSYG